MSSVCGATKMPGGGSLKVACKSLCPCGMREFEQRWSYSISRSPFNPYNSFAGGFLLVPVRGREGIPKDVLYTAFLLLLVPVDRGNLHGKPSSRRHVDEFGLMPKHSELEALRNDDDITCMRTSNYVLRHNDDIMSMRTSLGFTHPKNVV